jgi:predicted MFS family arabinose efflux permease
MTAGGFSGAYRAYMLTVLTLVYVMNGVDRSVMWVMLEPIKHEFTLSDTQLGWLSGFAFGVVYGLVAIPVAVLADRTMRTRIIAAAVGLWSAMTMLCGTASSFWMLFLARMGVGAAESAAPPASLSVISDLYDRRTRATAIAIYMSATMVALVLTFALGGWVAQRFGWRAAFFAAGVPGLVLGLLVWLTFREPPRGLSEEGARETAPVPFLTTCRFLVARPAICWMLLALTITALVSVGYSTFMVSFLIRSHGLSLAQAGFLVAYGHLLAAVGIVLMGVLADRLGQRDPRWRVWVPGIACIAGLPASLLLAFTPTVAGVFVALPVVSVIGAGTAAPVYAVLQEQVQLRMRATTMSFVYLLQNLIGIGFGAVLLGALSDAFEPAVGHDSLRYAIPAASGLFAAAAMCYAFAARTMSAPNRVRAQPHPVAGGT